MLKGGRGEIILAFHFFPHARNVQIFARWVILLDVTSWVGEISGEYVDVTRGSGGFLADGWMLLGG